MAKQQVICLVRDGDRHRTSSTIVPVQPTPLSFLLSFLLFLKTYPLIMYQQSSQSGRSQRSRSPPVRHNAPRRLRTRSQRTHLLSPPTSLCNQFQHDRIQTTLTDGNYLLGPRLHTQSYLCQPRLSLHAQTLRQYQLHLPISSRIRTLSHHSPSLHLPSLLRLIPLITSATARCPIVVPFLVTLPWSIHQQHNSNLIHQIPTLCLSQHNHCNSQTY